jgi:hypothetical protein
MFRAELTDEELESLFISISDWPGPCMNKQERNEVSDIVSRHLGTLPEDVAELRNVLNRFGSAPPTPQLPISQPSSIQWWNRPLTSAIIGGLIVGGAMLSVNHFSSDSKRNTAEEVRIQISQWDANISDNRKNEISAEVGKQLTPMNQTLTTLSQDIGKI